MAKKSLGSRRGPNESRGQSNGGGNDEDEDGGRDGAGHSEGKSRLLDSALSQVIVKRL